MQELASNDEQNLEGLLSQKREKIDVLVRDLRGIDGELEALSAEQHRYRLLGEVCGNLDELRELGAGALFWGEDAVDGQAEAQLRLARARVDSFEKRIGEIDARRQTVVEEIEHAEQDAEYLEDDIFEAKRKEEQRKLEWVIERQVEVFPDRPATMPWARQGEEDARFRKSLAIALLLTLFFGVVFPFIDLPLPEAWQVDEVPERLTRLIREEQPLPPRPPPPMEPKKLQEESAPELAEESSPTEPVKETPKPAAPSKGILAFREKFSALADSKPTAKLGAQARLRNTDQAATGRSQRSMVTSQFAGSSGGIDIASLSRDVGGNGEGGIEGVEIARATSSIGTGTGTDRPLSDGPGLSRTDEEIQIVFDRHKSALYRLYNRELRKNPTLKGQMVLRITIEPDGSVSLCELQSSDMKAPALSGQVVGRVRGFDFGAKDGIPAITILYPIDFLPAT